MVTHLFSLKFENKKLNIISLFIYYVNIKQKLKSIQISFITMNEHFTILFHDSEIKSKKQISFDGDKYADKISKKILQIELLKSSLMMITSKKSTQDCMNKLNNIHASLKNDFSQLVKEMKLSGLILVIPKEYTYKGLGDEWRYFDYLYSIINNNDTY